MKEARKSLFVYCCSIQLSSMKITFFSFHAGQLWPVRAMPRLKLAPGPWGCAGYICSHPWPGCSGRADNFVSSIYSSHLLCKHWLRHHIWQQQQAPSDLLAPAIGTFTFIEWVHSVSQVSCAFSCLLHQAKKPKAESIFKSHRLYCSPKSLNTLTH